MEYKHFGANSLKTLLLLVKQVFDKKADKTDLSDFITSQEKDTADIVEGYYEDEENYATIGYVDSEIQLNCLDTEPASSDLENEEETSFITSVSVSGTKLIISY